MAREFHKAVRKIVVLNAAPGGGTATSLEVYRQDKGSKRKRSTLLKQPERWVRAFAQAHLAMAQAYLNRHERSSHKRRDGWALDFGPNLIRSARTGSKQVQLRRLIRVPMLNP
ncbi:uncharacterized protein SOCE26_050440 [Sorangium cellulosum]|uniref:Uncharacterized protein n=1 Tax=Sorangium cellulosum TaxID=56 RepID=A0A2L0EWC2_SORCE|nr:hypothetical protein [Sorangium cellulosum]AUX43594.1 uncharacterized protein SOCE26_050440 [Sorangium cellulosum]